MRIFNLLSYMSIECRDKEQLREIIGELTEALIEIVEKRNCVCGGGFNLEEIDEEGNKI